MEKIIISATQKTPIIHLDNGIIEIKGRGLENIIKVNEWKY